MPIHNSACRNVFATLSHPQSETGQIIPLFAHRVMPDITQPDIDERARLTIERLRYLVQESLIKPRHDWDKACLLIAAEPNVTLERYAIAFFHGLEVHGKRKLHFFMPQAKEVSFDEMWMTRLMLALQNNDDVNARYLMASRVEQLGYRRLLFLARGLAYGLLDH